MERLTSIFKKEENLDEDGNPKKKKPFSLFRLMIEDKYNKPVDFTTNLGLNEPDTKKVIPKWFSILQRFTKNREHTQLGKFVVRREAIHDYTLPLPQKLYDNLYLKPISLKHRSVMLNLIAKYSSSRERSFLLRLRQEPYLNQHYRKKLYEIAVNSQKKDNVYADMSDAGFGFEFNILSATYLANGAVQEVLVDMINQMNSMVEFDTVFKDAIRSLKMLMAGSLGILVGGYFLVVYSVYILPQLKYRSVPFVFQVGLTTITSFQEGNLLLPIGVVTFIGLLVFMYRYFKVSDFILSTVPLTGDIIDFFESYKFYSTFKLAFNSSVLSEKRMITQAIKSIEDKALQTFLLERLDTCMEANDVYSAFFLSTSFFKEEDVVYLINPATNHTNKEELVAGIKKVLQNYNTSFKLREKNDTQKIELFGTLISGVIYVLLTALYVFGELQTFSISIGG